MVRRHKLPVEPGCALMTDLPLQPYGRERIHAGVRAITGKIVGKAALRKIVGHAPVIGVDPFDDSGPAQRLQPPDVHLYEGVGIGADMLHLVPRDLQMLRGTIDAVLIRDGENVAVGRARLARRGHSLDDHAPASVFGAGGAKLDVVDATVHAVDHEMHTIAHLVTAKAL